MNGDAPAYDVRVIQSWGFSRAEAIQAARRWALRCLARDGTDRSTLCYLQGLNGLASGAKTETLALKATGPAQART